MNTQIVNRERFFSRLSFTSSQPSSSCSSVSGPGPVEDDSGMVDVEGKVKTRLLSMWNNVKYGKYNIFLQTRIFAYFLYRNEIKNKFF